jgi:hypothetical protein
MAEPALRKGAVYFTMSCRPARHLRAVFSAPRSEVLESLTCSAPASLLHRCSHPLDVPARTSRSCCIQGKPARHSRRRLLARIRCSASRARNIPGPKDLESKHCPRFTIQTRVARDYTLKNYAATLPARLFAHDGNFSGGDFEADEFVAGVQVEKDFEIGGGSFESLVGFPARGGCAGGFHRDRAGR